jgi:hypothetical protein
MDRWMEFFTTPGRIRRLDSRRLVFLAISVVAFVLTEIVRRGLRPGLRSTGGIGLTLANSIGNLGGVVVQILFSLAILNSSRIQALRVIGFIVSGYIVYEFLQPVLPRGTFDWNDVAATLLGGVFIALPIVLVVFRVLPDDGSRSEVSE